MSSDSPITLSYVRSGSRVTIDLGIPTGVTNRFQISLTNPKIPMLKAENQFCMDNGTQGDYTISYTRLQPESISDSSSDSKRWSNKKWIDEISAMANRWQASTDGCTFTYSPTSYDDYRRVSENVYITQLSINYSINSPEEVSGMITLKVGTMKSGASSSADIRDSEMTVSMCDGTNSAWYYIWDKSSGTTCIDSLTISGGLNQPFESLSMRIPRRRLEQFAPKLLQEKGMLSGRNIIVVNAYGQGRFVMTKASLKDDVYTITGYSVAEVFRGTPTKYKYTKALTPYQIIEDILGQGVSLAGGAECASYSTVADDHEGKLYSNVSSTTPWSGDVEFPIGTNSWYVLQVCAMRLGARIFFSEGNAYLYDYTKGTSIKSIDLQKSPYAGNTIGNIELGGDGSQAIVNNIRVTYTLPKSGDREEASETITVHSDISQSSVHYGVKKGNTMKLPEIRNRMDAQAIAQGFMRYCADSQTSVTFRIREIVSSGWARTFDAVTWASKVEDDVDNITITNKSPCRGTSRPELLTLSAYRRYLPQGCSDYTFGARMAVDLSSTVSQILNTQNNG